MTKGLRWGGGSKERENGGVRNGSPERDKDMKELLGRPEVGRPEVLGRPEVVGRSEAQRVKREKWMQVPGHTEDPSVCRDQHQRRAPPWAGSGYA